MAATTLLAGCAGLLQVPAQSVQVAKNSVTIAGPAGYCVDGSATRDTGQSAFVLLGSCASIAGNARVTAPVIAGALTATVSVERGSDIDGATGQLDAFFRTSQGQKALARDGGATSASVLYTRQDRGAFIMKVRDTSPNDVNGLAQEYWRALFDVRGRIVTLSVNAFQDKPMSDAVGLATLNDYIARVRRENPVPVDQSADPV